MGLILRIYGTFKPDTTVKTVARAVTQASHMLKRTTSLVNSAYGEEHDGTSSIYNHGTSSNHCASPKYWAKQEDYMDEQNEALNKNGRDDLNDLYKNNQKFRDKIINFVGDKAELRNEKILDERYKHNTLNKLGMETLASAIMNVDLL